MPVGGGWLFLLDLAWVPGYPIVTAVRGYLQRSLPEPDPPRAITESVVLRSLPGDRVRIEGEPPTVALWGPLKLRPRMDGFFASETIATGDAEFDERFVASGDEAAVLAALSPEARATLVTFSLRWSGLNIDRGGVWIELAEAPAEGLAAVLAQRLEAIGAALTFPSTEVPDRLHRAAHDAAPAVQRRAIELLCVAAPDRGAELLKELEAAGRIALALIAAEALHDTDAGRRLESQITAAAGGLELAPDDPAEAGRLSAAEGPPPGALSRPKD